LIIYFPTEADDGSTIEQLNADQITGIKNYWIT